MRMPKIFVRKVILGAVLIALSAVITMMIKEALDTQNPESSLPILTVTCNGTPLTTETNNGAPANNEPVSLLRAGYEWSFFTTIERRTPPVTAEDLPLTPTTISAGVPISLTRRRAARAGLSGALVRRPVQFQRPDGGGNVYLPRARRVDGARLYPVFLLHHSTVTKKRAARQPSFEMIQMSGSSSRRLR